MNMKVVKKYILPGYLTIFHIAFIILLGFFSKYYHEAPTETNLYAMFMDVHSMMFVGFGFLMTFLKRYGFGSVGFNFIVAAYVLEWAMLIRGWLGEGTHGFEIGVINLLESDFCSAAILISFGAVIGKTSLTQLIIMATFEVVIQSVNEYIGLHYLKCYDVGESIYVHIFGAYFGMTVAKILHNKEIDNEKEESNYHSDLFAMIGTLFLYLYWPSFNSATAKDEGQTRAIVNTYLSITASVVVTFIMSSLVHRGKFNMVHIQNATLAGGVAVGAVADMPIQPFGAMIIGSFAGLVSVLGFRYLTPLLKRIYLHDTCGVHNLHGMPGVISGIASAIMAACASSDLFGGNSRLYTYYPSLIPAKGSDDYIANNLNGTAFSAGGDGRSPIVQGGYQMAGVALTLGMAIVGGIITGLVMKLPFLEKFDEEEDMFDDGENWKTPEDFDEATPVQHFHSPAEKVHAQY